jgi:GT2 family glycosyltransferase
VPRDFVVVLNFNGWPDTDRCVRSLLRGSPEAQVLVVDNGSSTPCPVEAESAWPGVLLMDLGENLGFTGGMNRGIVRALELGADTVTILNNDTVVPAGVIASLARTARTGVAVTPEVRYLGQERVWFGGGAVEPSTNLPHHLEEQALGPVDDRGLRETEVLAGCCVTATAETWTKVGLLDDRYFLMFEDSDWSVRARAAGVPLVVDTGITIEHAVSASFSGPMEYLGLYYYARNGVLFGREHGRRGVPVLRFLRRHVAPSIVRPAREGRRRQALRRAYFASRALVDATRGRYGRASAGLQRRATRWTSGKQ